jgi:hypothetical protein
VREKEVVAEQAYALVLHFGMVLYVAIAVEMWSLRGRVHLRNETSPQISLAWWC